MIDVSVLVGSQVRDGAGRTGRVDSISLPWVRVSWNQDHLFRGIQEVYSRSDPKIWTDFELFTLGGGWVSMGSILGARPRGRLKQFTEDIQDLLGGVEAPLTEMRGGIPDEEDKATAFKLLAAALKKTKVPLKSGKTRTAKPDEFMLMHMTAPYYHFKHRPSRNYIAVERLGGRLYIPKRNEPFFLGTFDESREGAETTVLYREQRAHPFRRHVFEDEESASEFVAQCLDNGFEEIRWRSDGMTEDWEVDLTGLLRIISEGCVECSKDVLESSNGTNLFSRTAVAKPSEPEDWDIDDTGLCLHVPSGFGLRVDME